MYLDLDEAGEYFGSRPEKPEERSVYEYVRWLTRKSAPEAIEDFYRLLFHGNAYPEQQVDAALKQIVTATDADLFFNYVINRCFYTIGNLWRLDKSRHAALQELITRVEHLPAAVPNDPTVRRLHAQLRAYVQSDLYPPLKRQMRLLGEADETATEHRLFGDDLRRFFFVQEAVTTTKDIPLSYRASIRQEQARIARAMRQRLTSYLASRRPNTCRDPLPNPTQIPDPELFQAFEAYRSDKSNSCLNQARQFEQHYRSLRTIGELKREMPEYVLLPLIEADRKYANNSFRHRFQYMLDRVDFDNGMPINDVSTTILCRRILQHLVVEDIHRVSAAEFRGMIHSVGHQVVTSVLLRLVLFWKRMRSWLEDRFGILFHTYEYYRKSDVSWVVQSFEHMNLALLLNAKWIGYLAV